MGTNDDCAIRPSYCTRKPVGSRGQPASQLRKTLGDAAPRLSQLMVLLRAMLKTGILLSALGETNGDVCAIGGRGLHRVTISGVETGKRR